MDCPAEVKLLAVLGKNCREKAGSTKEVSEPRDQQGRNGVTFEGRATSFSGAFTMWESVHNLDKEKRKWSETFILLCVWSFIRWHRRLPFHYRLCSEESPGGKEKH